MRMLDTSCKDWQDESRSEQLYMSGGAGYVLSREAVRRFREGQGKSCRPGDLGPEDVEMSRCLQRLGASFIDTRDSEGRWGPEGEIEQRTCNTLTKLQEPVPSHLTRGRPQSEGNSSSTWPELDQRLLYHPGTVCSIIIQIFHSIDKTWILMKSGYFYRMKH